MPIDLPYSVSQWVIAYTLVFIGFLFICCWALPMWISILRGHGTHPMILRFTRGIYFLPAIFMALAVGQWSTMDVLQISPVIPSLLMLGAAALAVRNAVHIDHLTTIARTDMPG